MNIEQAKAIPMTDILDKLGLLPERQNSFIYWYSSPLRNERTPSFQVNLKKNTWYDFGEGLGGDTVNFVCTYLKSSREDDTVVDALRWLKNMMGDQPFAVRPVTKLVETFEDEKTLVLKTVKPIKHAALKQYLDQRAIPFEVAQKYLKEVFFTNKETNKSIFALGFKNADEGYELRNQFYKGCIGNKTITFIRGKNPDRKSIHLFEGFMDFLSVACDEKDYQFDDDAIILNSLACIRHAIPYIKSYGYEVAYTWMDNDNAGKKATNTLREFFETEAGLKHKPMNDLYHAHEDVNAWHAEKPRP